MKRTCMCVLVLSLFLAACGDDKKTTSATSTTAASITTTTTVSTLTSACANDVLVEEGFTKLFGEIEFPSKGEAPSAEFKQKLKAGYDEYLAKPFADITANPPAEIKAELTLATQVLTDFVNTADTSKFGTPGFDEASNKVDAFFYGNCAGTKNAVKAVDYGYQGLPTTLTAGLNRFQFTNTGTEHHEMVVLARKAGVTDSFDAILKLPEEQGRAKVDSITQADSDSGKIGYTAVNLKPGSYVVVCFVNKGTVGDTEGKGAPHFTLGMKQEITVA